MIFEKCTFYATCNTAVFIRAGRDVYVIDANQTVPVLKQERPGKRIGLIGCDDNVMTISRSDDGSHYTVSIKRIGLIGCDDNVMTISRSDDGSHYTVSIKRISLVGCDDNVMTISRSDDGSH